MQLGRPSAVAPRGFCEPIGSLEARVILQDQLPPVARRLVLAVSGGADSLALLTFVAENRDLFAAGGRAVLVATVNHGLRAAAAAEALMVAAVAARSGLPHRTLLWHGGEGAGNLPARAREARYRLLREAARDFRADAVVTAHHEDDQIETHLMAVARREGAARRAGMRPVREMEPGLLLCRPLLAIAKTRLEGSLRHRGLAWAEDPSNRDLRYLRPRLRADVAALAGEARAALLADIRTASLERERIERAVAERLTAVSVDGRGAVRLAAALLEGANDVSLVLLSRAVAAAGGSARAASGRETARLLDRIRETEGALPATLGGCRIDRRDGAINITREFGRTGPPAIVIDRRADSLCFDERFDIFGPLPFGSARIVPLRSLGRGGADDAALPVVVDAAGAALAAHPSALGRLGGSVPALAMRERVGWRLRRDLETVIQNVAKETLPVGKDFPADYLLSQRATRPTAGGPVPRAQTPIQDG